MTQKGITGCICLWDRDGKWVRKCGHHEVQSRLIARLMRESKDYSRRYTPQVIVEDLQRQIV